MMNMQPAPVKLVIAIFPLSLQETSTRVERFKPILSEISVIVDILAATNSRQWAEALRVIYIFA